MNIIMIAVIQDVKSKQTIGFRLLDADEKNKYMDVSVNNIKDVLRAGKASIVNVGLVGDELVPLNGAFERYSIINPKGSIISKTAPLVIINQLGDAGYTVVDYQGKVKKAKTSDVVEYAKKYGIANGKVVVKDSIEFISSIAGSYPVEKIANSKVKDTALKLDLSLKHYNPTSSVAKNADASIKYEIDENDVFNAMTNEQKTVLRDYYTWYTVEKYESLAKSIRLNLAIGKAEKLAVLRGIQDWKFGGVWDSGFRGASQCALGHSLRYEYYAVPMDSNENNKNVKIVFGEDCASDFFSISKEDMNKLTKTRKIMSDEIEELADLVANNKQQEHMNKVELLYDIIKKLKTEQNIIDVFGNKVGKTLTLFMKVNLPFTMSLVLEASKKTSINPKGFFSKVFPEYQLGLDEIYGYNSEDSLVNSARQYLHFIATNKIEGDYAYDPLRDGNKRRDVGNYNKNARIKRINLISNLYRGLRVRKFDLDEINNVLYTIDTLIKNRNTIKSKIDTNSIPLKTIDLAIEFKNKYDDPLGIIIYNSLLTDERSSSFSDPYRLKNIKYIKEFADSIRLAEQKFDIILNDFIKFIEERSEEIRLQREQEEKDKIQEIENDKVAYLKKLIEENSDVPQDYGVNVAKSIISSNKLYKLLTDRQKWRINETIKYYESFVYPQKEDKLESDLKLKAKTIGGKEYYYLADNPEIKDKVEKVINSKDTDEMHKLDNYQHIIDIANSIIRYDRATNKQLKYIDMAINKLNLK